MLLSIVLTAYNSNSTIEKCLGQILNSESENFELIVVDDNSDVPCGEIVRSFCDNRVRYIYNDVNLGCGLSRNVGIDNIHGQFATFIDADDWYEQGAVDDILGVLSSRSSDLLVFDFSAVYGTSCVKKQWQPSNEGAVRDFLCDRLISTTWNKVYRVDILYNNNIRFPSYQSQDSVFNFRFLLRCSRIEKLDKFLYFFDKSGESITRSKYSMKSYAQVGEALWDMKGFLEDESTLVKLSFQECLELRRFLFLFKDPVLRIYRDWLAGRLDQTVLDNFLRKCEFNIFDVVSLFRLRLILIRDLAAFFVFKISPVTLFRLMKFLKTA